MTTHIHRASYGSIIEKLQKKAQNDKMNVAIRICPVSKAEISELQLIDQVKNNNIKIKKALENVNENIIKKENYPLSFSYDNILHKCSQEDVFNQTSKHVIDGVFEGYTGTIIAYGQSGTGKTYSLIGESTKDSLRGIIPRSVDHIFDKIKNDKKNKYNLFLSYVQIYMEKVYDLLEPKNSSIRIREDGKPRIEGIQWIKVNSHADVTAALSKGKSNKTELNIDSFKVHDIIILKMEKTTLLKSSKTDTITRTNLFFVDMASCEKKKKSKTSTIPVKYDELNKINYSLSVFRNCFSQYDDKNDNSISFTYKNSKLTRLLQDSIKGNSRISLIITISPLMKNYSETLSSLTFGQQAMSFNINPIQNSNKEVDYQIISEKLQENLDALNNEYATLKKAFDNLSEENILLNQEIFNLKRNSITSDINNNETKIIQELTQFYENKLISLKKENSTFIDEMDNLIINKDNLVNSLKVKNKNLMEENKKLNNILNETIFEKDELIKTIILFNKNNKNGDNLTTDNDVSNNADAINLNNILQKHPETTDQETQTDLAFNEEQLIEHLIEMCKDGKSLFDNIINQNKNFKLEFFILKLEKEIYKLNKENKEIREKLRKTEENLLKSEEFLANNIDDNLNLSFNSPSNNLLQTKSKSFVINNQNLTKEEFLLNLSNWNGLVVDKVICFDYENEKQLPNLLLSSVKKEYKNTEDSADTGPDTKISELKNEIIKLKTTIFKKNRKIEEYENIIQNNKKRESVLVKQAKTDLSNISNLIKESKSFKLSNSKENSQISGLHLFEEESSSILLNTNDTINALKYEYEQKIKTLNKTLENFQQNIISKQNELKITKISEENLKKKLEEAEKEIATVKDFFNSKMSKLKNKYKNKKKFMNEFQKFLQDNSTNFEVVREFFNIFSHENKKKFISDLFQKDMDFNNLDIYNYSTYLYKINELNFILKLDDQIDFNSLFFNKFSTNKLENNFKDSYNIFAQNLLKCFEIIVKTLIIENTKIFYYTNSINDLIKLNIRGKFENMMLQKQLNFHIEKIKRRSNSDKELLYFDNTTSTNDIIYDEHLRDSNDLEHSNLNEEKEKFEKKFAEILNTFDQKVININNENLFKNKKKSTYLRTSTLKPLTDNKFKLYLILTRSFFLKVDHHMNKLNIIKD